MLGKPILLPPLIKLVPYETICHLVTCAFSSVRPITHIYVTLCLFPVVFSFVLIGYSDFLTKSNRKAPKHQTERKKRLPVKSTVPHVDYASHASKNSRTDFLRWVVVLETLSSSQESARCRFRQSHHERTDLRFLLRTISYWGTRGSPLPWFPGQWRWRLSLGPAFLPLCTDTLSPPLDWLNCKTWKILGKDQGKVCTRAKQPNLPSLSRFPCSIKQLGVLLLPSGWDASETQGKPPSILSIFYSNCTHLYSWVESGTVKVKCFPREHNEPARIWIRTSFPESSACVWK